MKSALRPKIIAIVGGSGAGKTWLADRLQGIFGGKAARLSLDSFYLDRSHLPMKRREALNFDHPRAIDWALLEKVLRAIREGQAVDLPHYDFATHTRLASWEKWLPKPLVLADGLWLLWRPAIRELFDLRIFLDCAAPLRLRRRLARDQAERGRTVESIRQQFLSTVAPMHERFVAPQKGRADVVFEGPLGEREINQVAERIGQLLALNMVGRAVLSTPNFPLSPSDGERAGVKTNPQHYCRLDPLNRASVPPLLLWRRGLGRGGLLLPPNSCPFMFIRGFGSWVRGFLNPIGHFHA